MHLLESFSLYTGLKINKTWVHEKVYPCPFNKYIILNNLKSKNGYSFMNMIELLFQVVQPLENAGIGIIFLGEDSFSKLENHKNIFNITHRHIDSSHLAYLINNAELVCGSDEFCSALAEHFNKDNIFIGNKESILSLGPYFQNQSSLCDNDNFEDSIKVETLMEEIFKKLKIANKTTFSTKFIGNFYKDSNFKIIEVVPGQVISPESFKNNILNIRIDYLDSNLSEDQYFSIIENLKHKKCNILTNKPFNVEILFPFRKQILSIIYDVTKELNTDFLKDLSLISPNVNLLFKVAEKQSKESLEEIISSRKVLLIDFPYNLQIMHEPNFPEEIKLNIENFSYKTKKVIISNNKIYISKAALDSNSPIEENLLGVGTQKISDIKSKINVFESEDSDCTFIFSE